jgi:DNA-binding NarL/FixJ family response regulator
MIGHGDGLELLHRFRTEHPEIPVVVLSMHDEKTFAERAFRAGASGYVMKSRPSREILTAIRTVAEGEIYLSRKMATLFMRKRLKPESRGPSNSLATSKLTDRELHVFQLIGSGLSTIQIAGELGLIFATRESSSGAQSTGSKKKPGSNRCGRSVPRKGGIYPNGCERARPIILGIFR